MSPIGKIFIILNLVLAGLFLGFSANLVASGDDLKQEIDVEKAGRTSDLAKWEEEKSALTLEVNQAKEQARTGREERDRATDKANGLETQLLEAKNQNAQLRGEVTKLTEIQTGFNETIKALEQAKSEASDRAYQAEQERDAAARAQVDAERAMRDAEGLAQAAESRVAELEIQLTSAKKSISTQQTQLSTAAEIIGLDKISAQPDIDGLVVSIREDVPPGLVTLNVGSTHGVTKGMKFIIWGKDWKADVRVQSVLDDKCSALVVSRKDGQQIVQGDRASTKL